MDSVPGCHERRHHQRRRWCSTGTTSSPVRPRTRIGQSTSHCRRASRQKQLGASALGAARRSGPRCLESPHEHTRRRVMAPLHRTSDLLGRRGPCSSSRSSRTPSSSCYRQATPAASSRWKAGELKPTSRSCASSSGSTSPSMSSTASSSATSSGAIAYGWPGLGFSYETRTSVLDQVHRGSAQNAVADRGRCGDSGCS